MYKHVIDCKTGKWKTQARMPNKYCTSTAWNKPCLQASNVSIEHIQILVVLKKTKTVQCNITNAGRVECSAALIHRPKTIQFLKESTSKSNFCLKYTCTLAQILLKQIAPSLKRATTLDATLMALWYETNHHKKP